MSITLTGEEIRFAIVISYYYDTNNLHREESILIHSLRWSRIMMGNSCSRKVEQADLCIASAIKNREEQRLIFSCLTFFSSYSVWTPIHDMMTLTFSVDLSLSINFSGNILTTHTRGFIPEVIWHPGSSRWKINHYIFIVSDSISLFCWVTGQVSSSAFD